MEDREVLFLTQFIVESEAIEGIVTDPDDVKTQILDLHQAGHVGAILTLRAWGQGSRQSIDEALIKHIQRLIVEEQPSKGQRRLRPNEIGQWRSCNVTVTDDSPTGKHRIGADWERVPFEMEAWVRYAVSFQSVCAGMPPFYNISDIAYLHWWYERIHPFADGNGRSGRALALYLMWWASLKLFVFTSTDRHRTYYPCFEQSTFEQMERYFLNRSR